MNRMLPTMLLLLASSMIMMNGAYAKTANKTYFSGRNELQNNGRIWASRAPYSMTQAGARGLQIDALAFASSTKNTFGLGQYFGGAVKSDNSDANGMVIVGDSSLGLPNGLFDRQIDHTYDVDPAASMSGKLKLSPVQKRMGVVLGASIDLSNYFSSKGWHLSATLPVVQVKNNLGAVYTQSVAAVPDATTKPVSSDATIKNYFAGNYSQAGKNSQASLEYGKVVAGDNTSTGAADMKIAVGYDVVRESDGCVQVFGGIIVPLGQAPTADYLFEAVPGNGGHAGIVVGGRGDVQVWENKEKRMSLWFGGHAEYTFLFDSSEKRIAGIYNNDPLVQANVPWGHMALGVQRDQAGTFPLANVLARDMTVMPGSHFEATLGGSFLWKDFYVNLGYNMYYKKAETVDLAGQWPTDRYGMATYDYQGTTAASDFTAAALSTTGKAAVGPINVCYGASTATYIDGATVVYQIDPSQCAAPDQELHQAVVGFGYRRIMKNIPFDMSVVASYELSKDRTKAPNAWGLGIKVGVAL